MSRERRISDLRNRGPFNHKKETAKSIAQRFRNRSQAAGGHQVTSQREPSFIGAWPIDRFLPIRGHSRARLCYRC